MNDEPRQYSTDTVALSLCSRYTRAGCGISWLCCIRGLTLLLTSAMTAKPTVWHCAALRFEPRKHVYISLSGILDLALLSPQVRSATPITYRLFRTQPPNRESSPPLYLAATPHHNLVLGKRVLRSTVDPPALYRTLPMRPHRIFSTPHSICEGN